MTKAPHLLAGIVLTLALIGCQAPASHSTDGPTGRYLFSHDSRDLFITDTATGAVWYRSFSPPRDDKWTALGSPARPTTKP